MYSLLSSTSCFILLCWHTHYHKKHNHIHHDNLQHKIAMVNILHRALHKAAVCLVVWPTSPRPHKVRKKDCVWPKDQLFESNSEDVVGMVSVSSRSLAVCLRVLDSLGSVLSEQ